MRHESGTDLTVIVGIAAAIGAGTEPPCVLTRIPHEPRQEYRAFMSTREVRARISWVTTVAAAWLGSAGFLILMSLRAPTALKLPGEVLVVAAFALVPLVVATVLVRSVPHHPASALLAATGLILICTNSVRDGVLGPFAGTWMLLYLPFAILLLVMPSGTAQSPRWHAAGWALTVVVLLSQACVAGEWILPAAAPIIQPAALVLLALFLVGLCTCAVAPVAHYRAADDRSRLQLRWMYVIGSALPLTLLLCWSSYLLWARPDLVAIGLMIIYLALPLGTAISLLRPTLIDIDRLAVVVVVAGLLVAGMLVVLSAGALLAGQPLVSWSPILAIGATAALTTTAALCFRPLHRLVDRMLFPERARTVAALSALGRDVDRGLAAPEEVERVLQTALRDPGAVVGIRRLGDAVLVRPDGSPFTASGPTTSIRARGEELGIIAVASGRAKPPGAAIARAAAPLVDAVRTRAILAHAREEVEASRERMLRAGYDERRRLERDLHDGAQQRLVALGMNLRVLQRSRAVDRDVASSIDSAVAELGIAVAELRRLAHGVRPSALDDGLLPALADLVRQVPHIVELDVQAADLPDAVATTAYFVVSEGVTNALRHAGASRVRVRVVSENEVLKVTVSDDGCGGAVARSGGGLTGLSDRVRALGGDLRLVSKVDQGTMIEAVLPCVS